jgi:tetratricopeptide (TPR) repeat protein
VIKYSQRQSQAHFVFWRYSVATITEEIQQAYARGEIPIAMDMARDAIAKHRPEDPEVPILWVLLGWCHYRHQEYDVVRSCLQEAGDVDPALELAGYLAAYVDKDDVRLQEIAGRLLGNVNVQNALVIRARDQGSAVGHLTVLQSLSHFSGQAVEVANLYHNAARFFLAKVRKELGEEDLQVSLAFIGIAIEKYGVSANWHHRAAASFWKSHILDRLGDKREALHSAEQSLFLWNEAVDRDPQNKGFKDNRDNAIKRIAELQ